MNEENKKYYFGLLKRYGIVIGSSLLLACGVKYCKNKNIEEIVDNSEIMIDSLENLNNYSIKFKN